MIIIFKKVMALFAIKEKKTFNKLLFLMVVIGILETLGTVCIMPFLYLVTKPHLIQSNQYFKIISEYFVITNPVKFILLVGAIVFLIVFLGFALRAFANWKIAKFAHNLTFKLSNQLLKIYLNQPYTWFLNKNSADLNRMLTIETNIVTTQVLMPLMHIFSNFSVALCLSISLLIISPKIAFFCALIFGGAFCLLYYFQSNNIIKLGRDRFKAQGESFKIIQEVLGGIKEIKVAGVEKNNIINFDKPALILSSKLASIQILSDLPLLLFQAIAFGGIISVVLIIVVLQNQQIESIIPLLALYSFATIRLIPAFHKIYAAFSLFKFNRNSLNKLLDDMQLQESSNFSHQVQHNEDNSVMKFERQISFRGVSFVYPNANNKAVSDLSFEIELHSAVGIAGNSGGGKTTTVDILLGLLSPTSGSVFIDDMKLTNSNYREWQKQIGYIPQSIFLTDDTIFSNIAFGIPTHEIDKAAVIEAAKIAEIHPFIYENLEHKYDTVIGERGIRLSGGQRQRIGIARALYKKTEILILDEATNAIDDNTEKKILKNIKLLVPAKTILIITHHVENLSDCEQILFFENGKICDSGSFEDVKKRNKTFR